MSGNEKNRNFRILIVDDDDSTRSLLNSILSAEGYDCLMANSVSAAEKLLRQEPVQMALIDLYLGTANGLNVLDLIKVLQPQCACVIMTAHTSVETVTKSLGSGAIEYLGKPLLIDDLLALVRRVQASHKGSKESTASVDEGPETSIIGRTTKMLEVYRAIARVAPTEASVLIVGASGTGKELVARALHDHSARAHMPFVPVNCGALPENILESELFGHEKGAYTGADSSRPGLFEAAHGGTLFLDEISETKPGFQVNLLRAVQEQQIRRVGSHKYTPVNVRILAASNRDLTKLMSDGKFREDLYYRLSVVVINLPTLEERREDIPLLVQHFLKRSNKKSKRNIKITEAAVKLLTSYSWPGNVRELENLVERLAIFCTSGEIGVADVERERQIVRTNGVPEKTPPTTLEDMERQHILRVLQEHAGNKSKAARALGIERKTLYQKARRLGIDLMVG
ncbi:MAG TPA: sigma-54 dependent transcriptional regulator [Candidatus Angelobacter sp.]|nr:sigma-54 dependent transcriptional regulator [Candidatus Angelobacter sp.]